MTHTTKKILIVIILAAVVVAIAGFIKFNVIQDDVYIEQPDGSVVKADDIQEYIITTEDGLTGTISYISTEQDLATLSLNGEFYQLQRAISGSGAKYANIDETVSYWEHQGQATVELADGTTYLVTNIEKK